jgi:hypothetical protein
VFGGADRVESPGVRDADVDLFDARVIHVIAEADVEPGDILVTAYTDPAGPRCSSRSRGW